MKREETGRELELITATVHELKTPLTIIKGMGHNLAIEFQGSLNAQQKEQVKQINEAAQRLSSMIESLLHIDNLPYRQDFRPAQVNSELRAALDDVADQARSRQVKLYWYPTISLPPVLVDSTSVYQLLTQALTAAIRHAPRQSEVKLATRRSRQMVVIQVETPGNSIKPGEAKQITAAIGRHLQPVKSHGGSALSWYIIKSIVEFYSGSLKVSSRANNSIVTISLPVSNQLSLFV